MATDSFTKFRPMFLAALGHLARSGYSVPAGEGLDLLHDFYIEAWNPLLRNFDASRAKLRTYAFAAFVRFARPRIVRLTRWQRQLHPDPLTELTASEGPSVETQIDIDRLRSALDGLPELQRRLLVSRFGAERSERNIAEMEGISRYRAREQSVEALAHLVTTLGDRSLLDAEYWPLAHALWNEGRSLSDAASRLGMTEAQAKIRKRLILDSLARAASFAGPRITQEDKVEQLMCELWKKVTSGRQSIESVEVADRNALLDHLEECPGCSERLPEDPERTAALFLALAGPDEEQDAAHQLELLKLRESVDEDVRTAVKDLLYTNLSEDLVAQAAAWDDPLTVFRAIDGVSMLVHRFSRHLSQSQFLLGPDGLAADPKPGVVAGREVLMREIRITSGISTGVEQLYDWTIASARSYPRLFPSIVSSPVRSNAVRLTVQPRPAEIDLTKQWAPEAIP